MKNIGKYIQKFRGSRLFYPVVLLAIGFVAYGLMLPRLGFYWDDWESVYLYYLHNPAISFQYFAERAFSTLPYLVLFPVVKMTPVTWQVIGILLRWAGVLFLYLTLNVVWPERTWSNRWISALLLVFPGFFQQPLAVTYSRHLTAFALFTLSLYLTVLAIQRRRAFWLWMPVSVLFGVLQFFMLEYFVVLEIIRPVLIWYMLRSEGGDRRQIALKTFLYWLPFVIGLGAYGWWRFVYIPTIFPSDPYDPVFLKALLQSPVSGLLALMVNIYTDARYLFVNVWMDAFFNPTLFDLREKVLWFSWFVGILAAVLLGLFANRDAHLDKPGTRKTHLPLLVLGAALFIAGGIPVWSIGRQISVGKWSDRFALAPMLGVVIFLVFLIGWFFKTSRQKQILLVLLLGFSISSQIFNVNSYRLDWVDQRELYWQLAWRIPSLKPGTMIVGKGTFTDKGSVYDATYTLNLLFDKQVQTPPRYAYLDVFHLPSDKYYPDLPITATVRAGTFSGNTSQVVGMYFNLSGGCVRLLDPIYTSDPGFTTALNNLIPISNLNMVTASNTPTSPNPDIFGSEPARGWCYYFEKADLARQMQDWQMVTQLGALAEAKGLKPHMGAEYLPFIEAEAQTGEWSKAFQLSLAAQKLTPNLETTLCSNWVRFSGISSGSGRDTYLAEAKTQFCANAGK